MTRASFQSFLAAVACACLSAVAPARAESLIFFDESAQVGPRALYNYDTATGAVSFRASISGDQRFFSMTSRPSDGLIFAAEPQDFFNGRNGLYTIDANTGATTLVGTPGTSLIYSGIAFDPTSGILYALGFRSNLSYGLYTVNTATAAATLVGDLTLGRGARLAGLAFSDEGDLYAIRYDSGGFGNLIRFDVATGATTRVGTGTTPVGNVINGGVFDSAGNYITTDFNGQIYSTDVATGVGRLVGTSGLSSGLGGITRIAETSAVPEPSSVALLGLGGLGLALAARARRAAR